MKPLLAALILGASLFAVSASAKTDLTGSFSNIHLAGEDGDDLVGFEMSISKEDNQYFGSLVESVGEPQPPTKGTIKWIDKSKGKFEMMISDPKQKGSKFTGEVTKSNLHFRYVLPNGVVRQESLTRK